MRRNSRRIDLFKKKKYSVICLYKKKFHANTTTKINFWDGVSVNLKGNSQNRFSSKEINLLINIRLLSMFLGLNLVEA